MFERACGVSPRFRVRARCDWLHAVDPACRRQARAVVRRLGHAASKLHAPLVGFAALQHGLLHEPLNSQCFASTIEIAILSNIDRTSSRERDERTSLRRHATPPVNASFGEDCFREWWLTV
jgi:hypothetical protein